MSDLDPRLEIDLEAYKGATYSIDLTCYNCHQLNLVQAPVGMPIMRFRPAERFFENKAIGGNMSCLVRGMDTVDNGLYVQELTCRKCQCPQLQ